MMKQRWLEVDRGGGWLLMMKGAIARVTIYGARRDGID